MCFIVTPEPSPSDSTLAVLSVMTSIRSVAAIEQSLRIQRRAAEDSVLLSTYTRRTNNGQ